MKKGLVIGGPDVPRGALALLEGTFEEKLSKAAKMGFDGIELMVRDPAALDWRAVKEAVDAVGLQIPQVVTAEFFRADGLCLITADTDLALRAEQRFRSAIDLAAFLGAMVNLGRVRGRLDLLGHVDNAWELAVDRLRSVVSYAMEREVRITLEPLNRYESDFILNAKDGLRLIRELDLPNLGLMLDLFHMNIEEANIEKALRESADRLWHVHVADSNRCSPGAGHLDFSGPFSTLKAMNYAGFVSAELLPLPDPDTAAEKTMAFLREYEASSAGLAGGASSA